MTIEKIKDAVRQVIKFYPVSRVTLFGSQAAGNATENSDVDLIVEFSQPISLLTLSGMLKSKVDLIHGPIRDTDMIEVGQEVLLYAA